MPDALTLDLRIERKCGCARLRQPHVDGVVVVIAGKAKAEVDWLFPARSLNGKLALTYRAGNRFGACPQCGLQSAFARDGGDDASLCDICQQPQRSIQV